MEMLTGSCLCGKVGIEVPDDFDYMGNCHCSDAVNLRVQIIHLLVGFHRQNLLLQKVRSLFPFTQKVKKQN